jgi:hypothetical protein
MNAREAATVLETAIADYRTAMAAGADLPPAKDILAYLESSIQDVRLGEIAEADDPAIEEKIVAFAKIEGLWPKPRPLDANDPFLAQIAADSEEIRRPGSPRFERPNEAEPNSLIGILVEGVRFAARLESEAKREKRALDATVKAAEALEILRGFVRAIEREGKAPTTNTPLDAPNVTDPSEIERVHEGLRILSQIIEDRAYLGTPARLDRKIGGKPVMSATPERFGVGREALAKPKGRLPGPTMEGVRLAARRLRAMAPKATLEDLSLVLNCAFGTGSGIDDTMLKNLTAKVKRKRKAQPSTPQNMKRKAPR